MGVSALAFIIIGGFVAGFSYVVTYLTKSMNFNLFMGIGLIMFAFGLGKLLIFGLGKKDKKPKKINHLAPPSHNPSQAHTQKNQNQNVQQPTFQITNCPYCRARIPFNSVFCAYCGRRLR